MNEDDLKFSTESWTTHQNIDHMFSKGALECRNMEWSLSGGKRMKGTTWDEVLDALLKDLNASEKEDKFSVSSYEECVSLKLLEKIPEEVNSKCNQVEKEHVLSLSLHTSLTV